MKFALVISFALVLGALPANAGSNGDAERGEVLFKSCKACHQVGEAAGNGVGPHLNQLFGRIAGSLDWNRYSPDMQQQGTGGLQWNAENLDAFLQDPKAVVPRTRMNFRAMARPDDRADLIAYLQLFSAPQRQPIRAQADAEPGLDPAILQLQGDVAYGQYLSGECVTCHLSDGSAQGIPAIIGWPARDFVIALHAYKNKQRPNPVMQLVTGRLSNEEIAALAAYFSGLN